MYAALTQKEKSRSYDLIDQYLRSSPECSEILLAVSDKDIYYKPEVFKESVLGYLSLFLRNN